MLGGNSIFFIMDKGTKNVIACTLLAVVILVCLFACGKRTTATTRSIIKSDTLKVDNNFELKQNSTFSDISTVRPIDASKPMFWAGAWHYNVVLEFDKSIKKGVELKSNESLSYSSSGTEVKDKNTVKTDYSNVWVGLSMIIGTLFVLYLALKKYIP